jgi:hypothetical protein
MGFDALLGELGTWAGADAGADAAIGLGADATAGAGLAASADAALPTIAITAPAAAATGAGVGDLAVGGLAAGAGGLGAAGALGGAGGGGPIGGAAASAPDGLSDSDIASSAAIGPQTLASNSPLTADVSGGASALMPTTDASVTSLSPDLASQLGVTPDAGADSSIYSLTGGATGTPGGAAAPDMSGFNIGDPGAATGWQPMDPANPLGTAGSTGAVAPGGQSTLDQFGSWISQPKNAITAGMLGLAGVNAIMTPKLPSAANTALGAAGPAVQAAQSVIQSGGMSGPAWTQQKASIDASIQQQLQQLTDQIKQNAATSGQGTTNSGLVQQQIAQATEQLETQRQQLYMQAAEQNVQTAVSELTGGNATLSSIASMQLAQSNTARQQSAQLAQLAAALNQSSIPGG